MEKLDAYEYTILPGIIRIHVQSTTDPELVDILSGIERANGQIYVDGFYYQYLDRYEIVKQWNNTYLELHVIEVA
jgi:hypothetical protein